MIEIVLPLALGALMFAFVFFRGEKARKAGPGEAERMESSWADWSDRASFWLAEHRRALEEDDLLARELAESSMEFLLDTRPPEVPARSREERHAEQAESRMTDQQSRKLQHTALLLYQSEQIGYRAFDYIRKARQLGLSAREADSRLQEEVARRRREEKHEVKFHRIDAMPELPSKPWGVFVCDCCHRTLPDDLIHLIGEKQACPACWGTVRKGTRRL